MTQKRGYFFTMNGRIVLQDIKHIKRQRKVKQIIILFPLHKQQAWPEGVIFPCCYKISVLHWQAIPFLQYLTHNLSLQYIKFIIYIFKLDFTRFAQGAILLKTILLLFWKLQTEVLFVIMASLFLALKTVGDAVSSYG